MQNRLKQNHIMRGIYLTFLQLLHWKYSITNIHKNIILPKSGLCKGSNNPFENLNSPHIFTLQNPPSMFFGPCHAFFRGYPPHFHFLFPFGPHGPSQDFIWSTANPYLDKHPSKTFFFEESIKFFKNKRVTCFNNV